MLFHNCCGTNKNHWCDFSGRYTRSERKTIRSAVNDDPFTNKISNPLKMTVFLRCMRNSRVLAVRTLVKYSVFDFWNNDRLLRVDVVKGCAHRYVQARHLTHAQCSFVGNGASRVKWVGAWINRNSRFKCIVVLIVWMPGLQRRKHVFNNIGELFKFLFLLVFSKVYRICLVLPDQLTSGSVQHPVSWNSFLFEVGGGRLLTSLF